MALDVSPFIFSINRLSSAAWALAKPSMPSASFSFAIRSFSCISRKMLSFICWRGMFICCAALGSSLRLSSPPWLANSASSLGAMVSRSHPASSRISPTLRNEAPITSVLWPCLLK